LTYETTAALSTLIIAARVISLWVIIKAGDFVHYHQFFQFWLPIFCAFCTKNRHPVLMLTVQFAAVMWHG
jgi:hypothetical protein